MSKLRCYFSHTIRDDCLCAVIAKNAKEAKTIVFKSEYAEGLDLIEIKVRWSRGANTEGFSKCIINDDSDDCLQAIKQEIFTSQDENCEFCDYYQECKVILNSF